MGDKLITGLFGLLCVIIGAALKSRYDERRYLSEKAGDNIYKPSYEAIIKWCETMSSHLGAISKVEGEDRENIIRDIEVQVDSVRSVVGSTRHWLFCDIYDRYSAVREHMPLIGMDARVEHIRDIQDKLDRIRFDAQWWYVWLLSRPTPGLLGEIWTGVKYRLRSFLVNKYQ